MSLCEAIIINNGIIVFLEYETFSKVFFFFSFCAFLCAERILVEWRDEMIEARLPRNCNLAIVSHFPTLQHNVAAAHSVRY
jgi:hypothetical protein